MAKNLRVILFIILIVVPVIFHKAMNKKSKHGNIPFSSNNETADEREEDSKPIVALIFDDLGESLNELREVYSLGIPLTISIIPNLKFSKNIAHIGSRCGFSVFIHLPLQPIDDNIPKSAGYKFISSDLSNRGIKLLLRQYLNSLRIATGVNNHMGSKATQNTSLMKIVMKEIKKRKLIFIDSNTSTKSVAYSIAKKENLVCGYNEGFLDASDNIEAMKQKVNKLIEKAKSKGKIIIIAHPKKNTIDFLKRELPVLRKHVKFVTIKEFFAQ